MPVTRLLFAALLLMSLRQAYGQPGVWGNTGYTGGLPRGTGDSTGYTGGKLIDHHKVA